MIMVDIILLRNIMMIISNKVSNLLSLFLIDIQNKPGGEGYVYPSG